MKSTAQNAEVANHVGAKPLLLQYSRFTSVRTTKSCEVFDCTWGDLVRQAQQPLRYASKDAQPLIKLATYGKLRNVKGSIRHNDNLVSVSGLEVDYDGGQVSPTDAAQLLRSAGIRSLVYTSASHTRAAPRWRVLAPLSAPVAPEDRAEYVSMLNGVLGGILAPESWVRSQSFYWGAVEGVEYEVHSVDGEPIDAVDLADGLMVLPCQVISTVEASRADREEADIAADAMVLDRVDALAQVDDRTIAEVRSAVVTLKDEADEYNSWTKVGHALKSLGQAGREADAVKIWHHFSRLSPKYDFDETEEKWVTFNPQAITYRTVFELAAAHGWVNPRSAEALQARVQDRTALEEERRRHQVEENIRLGEGSVRPPAAEIIDLEGALRRFVFLSEGSRVADVFNPHYDLAYADWAATHAASKAEVPQRARTLANGKTKELPPKLVPVSGLWQSSALRQTAVCRTFKADGPATLLDPDGRFALNSWKPFDRSLPVDDLAGAGVGLFIEQVKFLFGTDTDRFLDWLAHIEQCPGVLPHTAWLHVATSFGMGRNWLASVLARVWTGSVASNLDLVDMLDSGFNGRLSRKVLATVDEIREGGRGEQWAHAERLKSLLNEETRSINPKYGRRTLEFNACRWLVFSNHISALPIEDRDRRWQVVINEHAPREPDWYLSLYRALDDRKFIAAVACFLKHRDLTRFNPGEKASESQAKADVVRASKSPIDQWVDLIVEHWPCDVAPSALLAHVLGLTEEGGLSPAHRRALERGGIASLGRLVRIDGHPTRLSIVRRKPYWAGRDAGELRAEWERGRVHLDMSIAEGGLRDFLSGAAADAEVVG